jgi:polysaccharide biosynthesis/export protein
MSQTRPQYDSGLGNRKPEIGRTKIIQVPGNPPLRRYCGLSVLVIFSLLVFVGCSSTPSMQTLEHSAGMNPSQIGASSAQSTQLAPSAGFPSENQGLGNLGADNGLPGIQAPGGGKYVLAPGDAVTVTVWGHPELSGKRIIGPDGDIQLPFVGSFKVAGYNADDASGRLSSALREDYVNTAASVTVDSYNGNQVTVLGHVAHQGVLTFPNSPTLLEALAMAGAAPSTGDQSGMPTRCAIVRGRDRIMWVDLRPLMKGTDLALNIPLQRNDLVFVPDPDDALVYVMGQVKNPGPYTLTANMSFLEALSRAGGPNDNAQPGKIVLARPSKNTEQIVDLENNIKQGGTNYQLEPGDIVYVPKSGLAQLGYFFQQINPLTSMVLFGAALM